MESNTKKGIFFAIFAAALYAVNAPFSKILLEFMPSTLMMPGAAYSIALAFMAVGAWLSSQDKPLFRKRT